MLKELVKIAIGSALTVSVILLTGCGTANQTDAPRPPIYSEEFKSRLADEIVEKDIQDGSAIGEALKDLCVWAEC